MTSSSICITVFACATIPKYRAELDKIRTTWGKTAQELGIRVIYFLGEEKTDLIGKEFVYLPGVGNDYNSASHKQNHGLKYATETYCPDFIFCIGTDTYVEIHNLIKLISNFDPNDALYIGGHGSHRSIGPTRLYYHSGGPGLIFSRATMTLLLPHLSTMYSKWCEICDKYNAMWLDMKLHPSCDVAIAWFVAQENGIKIVTHDEGFFHCTWQGGDCRVKEGYPHCTPDPRKLIGCHYISPNAMDYLHNYYKNNSNK